MLLVYLLVSILMFHALYIISGFMSAKAIVFSVGLNIICISIYLFVMTIPGFISSELSEFIAYIAATIYFFAGALCWFPHSDYEKLRQEQDPETIEKIEDDIQLYKYARFVYTINAAIILASIVYFKNYETQVTVVSLAYYIAILSILGVVIDLIITILNFKNKKRYQFRFSKYILLYIWLFLSVYLILL